MGKLKETLLEIVSPLGSTQSFCGKRYEQGAYNETK
jgi:hypothetical protein